jgi:dsRNA-specific ribonuclease
MVQVDSSSLPEITVTSDTPPPYLRPDITDDERNLIESVLGPVTDESVLRAVRDGRGREFQRLEFVGDSVLDVILTAHQWIERDCAACAGADALPDASDHALAAAASEVGLGSWLEWQASPERIADLVETCVAACWLSGRWAQASTFVSHVVHPVGDATVAALERGATAGSPGRAARRVGSAMLELAAAWGVYLSLPDADEGTLSTRRATLHRASAVAAIARGSQGAVLIGDVRGDDVTVLSQVEDALAVVMASSGADECLRVASLFVPAPTGEWSG